MSQSGDNNGWNIRTGIAVHGGEIEPRSKPGKGSPFALGIPVAARLGLLVMLGEASESVTTAVLAFGSVALLRTAGRASEGQQRTGSVALAT